MSWLRDIRLRHNPFVMPINSFEDIFETGDLLAVQEFVTECAQEKMMGVIVGPPGAGKSTGVFDQIDEAKHTREKPLVPILPGDYTINFERLRCGHMEEAVLRKVIDVSGVSEKMHGRANVRTIQLRRLLGQLSATHDVVLVIDDAHALAPSVLKELKRLMELKWAGREHLLAIIMLAHPQFELDIKELKEVDERTQMLKLRGMSSEETAEYIQFKFTRAGADWHDYITPEAVQIVADATRLPLEVNKLMTTLLKQAWEIGEVPISKDLAMKHCATVTSLAALKYMSGVAIPEICRLLKSKFKLDVSRDTVKRVLAGGESMQDGVKEAITKVLTHYADLHRAQGEPIPTRLNERQQQMMSEMHVLLAESDYNFDWLALAGAANLRRDKFYSIVFGGKDPNEAELAAILRVVKAACADKKRRTKAA